MLFFPLASKKIEVHHSVRATWNLLARLQDSGVYCLKVKVSLRSQIGVCSTDLRLDTSTNGLKLVYTSLEAIY
jgi:hypothetical protein